MVVPVAPGLLSVDVLPQGRSEHRPFEVVCPQGVPGQERVDIPRIDEGGHGISGIVVEGDRGAKHPDDESTLPLVPEQLVKGVVVTGIGGLPRSAGTEGKRVAPILFLLPKRLGVHVDPLAAVLRASHEHRFPGPQAAELHDVDPVPPRNGNAVHAALLRQQPTLPHLKIFGEDGHGMKPLRGDPIPGCGGGSGRRGLPEFRCVKIGSLIFRKLKGHSISPHEGFPFGAATQGSLILTSRAKAHRAPTPHIRQDL